MLGELYRLLPKPKLNTNQARSGVKTGDGLPNGPRLKPRGCFVATVFAAEVFFEDARFGASTGDLQD